MDKQGFLKLLGKQIKSLRQAKGWTQTELAYACNKDRQSLERVENGKSNPTVKTLKQIADALDVPLRELFDFDIR